MSTDPGYSAIQTIKPYYRSGEDDIGRDFFLPCIRYCTLYQRAVGFFCSSALITWAEILPDIAREPDRQIQLLISPYISDEDLQALRDAVNPSQKSELLSRLADRFVIDALEFARAPDNADLRLKLLTWMVVSGRLDLRFAFPEHEQLPGLFHEKIGVFRFPWGDTLAFTGSANETSSGYSRNYETIDVFRDWIPEDQARVQVKVEQFARAWEGRAVGLRTVHLSDKALDCIRAIAPSERPLLGTEMVREENKAPSYTTKWRHQDEAISGFLDAERGVLEMATGTGKTRTALRICSELVSRNDVSTIIVTTDGTDLLDQWHKQLLGLTEQLGYRFPILRHYADYHETQRFTLNPTRKILLVSRSALAPALRSLSPADAYRTLLIHDEVHRLGSPGNRAALSGLSDQVRFRLGLSATPEREYDQDGTQFIEDHVGPTIFEFGLTDAIRRGILAPFNYYPLEYTPDDGDALRIQQVYARVAARRHEGRPMTQEEIWIELAKVHKTSKAKLPVFEQFIEQHKDLLNRCIIFVETKEYGDDVLQIVHRHSYEFHTYYADEDSEVLRRFARDEIRLLLTCHRLSEGIDIQSIATVILFSSARTRLETIQRMGRCLRTDPQNPAKAANVVDFIRADESGNDVTADSERRAWLSELAQIRPEEGDV